MACSDIASEIKGCGNPPFDPQKYILQITLDQIRSYIPIIYFIVNDGDKSKQRSNLQE
jgi:hypothetical protein